jgi:hypothetical protein
MAFPLTAFPLRLLAKFKLDLEVSDGTYPLINFYFKLKSQKPTLRCLLTAFPLINTFVWTLKTWLVKKSKIELPGPSLHLEDSPPFVDEYSDLLTLPFLHFNKVMNTSV